MKRMVLLLVSGAVLASLATAQSGAPQPLPGKARHFQRNYGLVRSLVESSLRLAEEDDPLKRAQCCNDLLERFASEVNTAAEEKDLARVLELGQHLHDLLAQGVAANLRAVRKQFPEGSSLDKILHDARARAERSLQPVEVQLARVAGAGEQDEVQRTLRLILDGRTELEKAITLKDDSGRKAGP